MALSPQQAQTAKLLIDLATSKGLSPARAREFAAAAMAESGLNPGAVNKSSGASGLFQLLSPGYRQKAQALGGLNNPKANALAILPDYQSYWRAHPNAAPGEGGAAVERSGQGAGFYAKPLSMFGALAQGQVQPGQPAPVQQAPDMRRQLGMALLQTIGDKTPDFSQVLALAKQRNEAVAPAPQQHQPAADPNTALGRAILAKGADRAGVQTDPSVLQFVSQISQIYGKPLTIGTGTNHNEYVAGTHRESAHWTGHAADIPASGASLTKLGQDALIAAGMPPAQARKQKGGLFNVGNFQVIFNTNEGGNHFNHLHVGVR